MPMLVKYNRDKGLKSFEDVALGEETLSCQSSWQIENDGRYTQMRDMTVLDWHYPDADMKKQFIIISITPGFIGRGIPKKFDGNILRLRRV